MLFRKKMEKSCAYCAYGVPVDEEQILCARKGLRPMLGNCRRFQYDPTKRIPAKPKAMDFTKYDREDFSL